MGVQADQVEPLRGEHRVDSARGEAVGEAEPELGVELPGLDMGVGLGPDPGRDPDQDPLAGAGLGADRVQAVDLLQRVADHVPDAGGDRLAQLGIALVVAVHVHAPGVESGS